MINKIISYINWNGDSIFHFLYGLTFPLSYSTHFNLISLQFQFQFHLHFHFNFYFPLFSLSLSLTQLRLLDLSLSPSVSLFIYIYIHIHIFFSYNGVSIDSLLLIYTHRFCMYCRLIPKLIWSFNEDGYGSDQFM